MDHRKHEIGVHVLLQTAKKEAIKSLKIGKLSQNKRLFFSKDYFFILATLTLVKYNSIQNSKISDIKTGDIVF